MEPYKRNTKLIRTLAAISLLAAIYIAIYGSLANQMATESGAIGMDEIVSTMNNFIPAIMQSPNPIKAWNSGTSTWLMFACGGWFIAVVYVIDTRKKYIRGKEHGTAEWGQEQHISDLFAENLLNAEVIPNIKKAYTGISYTDDYDIAKQMYYKMFHYYTITTIEWCGLSLATGAGTVNECDDCNNVHAKADCPNYDEGTHTRYKCGKCCNKQSGAFINCDGYKYCDGHTVNFTYIYFLGGSALISDQFAIPLEKLKEQGKEDTTEYKDLSAFHELTVMLAEMNYDEYGDVLNGVRYYPDIKMLNAIPTNREGCEQTVTFGLSFVKPESYGRPNIFTNYAGFSDDWCAMFANYIHENAPCGEHDHSAVQIRSWSTSSIMATAKACGQWMDGNYTAPAPGDWILFNWRYAPGHEKYSIWATGCHHIGVVTHVDGSGNVHYVHGNTSGDSVRHQSRPLTDIHIRGYVVMFP